MKKDILPGDRVGLVLENMKLVDWIIQHRLHISMLDTYYEDYRQEGFVGLILAAIRYDEEREIKFATFAYQYIINVIRTYRNEKVYSYAHLPRQVITLRGKIIQMLVDGYTFEEVCLELHITSGELDDIIHSFEARSLDTPIVNNKDGSSVYVSDMIGSEDKRLTDMVDTDIIEGCIQQVAYKIYPNDSESHKRNRNIWFDYIWPAIYGEHITNDTLAEKYGTSQPNVSRVLSKLKKELREMLLKE